MLLTLFKNNRTTGIVLVGLLLLLAGVRMLVEPMPWYEGPTMPLYDLLFKNLELRPVLHALVVILFFAIISIQVVRLNAKYSLVENRSYMPSLFWLLIIFTFPGTLHLTPALVATPFLLATVSLLLGSHDKAPETLVVFNASLLLVLGCAFWLKLLWFFPLTWIISGSMRQITIREVLHPLAALFLYVLFSFTWDWVVLDQPGRMFQLASTNLAMEAPSVTFSTIEWSILGFLALLILVSSAHQLNWMGKQKIILRNIYRNLFFLFFYSLAFYLLVSNFFPAAFGLPAIPLAYLFANYFHRRSTGRWHGIILYAWIILLGVRYYLDFAGG